MSESRRTPHDVEQGLTGEHRLGDAGQAILAGTFAIVWIVDTFFLGYTTFLNRYVPLILRIVLGIAFLAMAWYLARSGLRAVFREHRDEPGVIRDGVFGLVRHPIYAGEVVLYLSFLAFSLSLAAAAVWLVAIGFLYYICRYEERLLRARFGAEYEDYMREVPMWIPRSGRKRAG